MSKFQNTWSKPASPSLTEKVSTAIKPQGALKPRVEAAIVRMQKQTAKLDAMLDKLRERDSRVFEKIVEATQRHDEHGKKVLANELAEIRKVTRVLGSARTALQQIELRLSTAHDLGDTVVTIMPTIGLMKGMKSSLSKFMPGADQEIGKMAEMLGGFMTESFSGDAAFGTAAVSSDEADKILQEAGAIAENSLDSRLPATPDMGESSGPASTKFL